MVLSQYYVIFSAICCRIDYRSFDLLNIAQNHCTGDSLLIGPDEQEIVS